MEQFIIEIEAYSKKSGVSPQRLLRDAVGAPWWMWEKWKAGDASPTMRTADKIRSHIETASNQPARASA